MTPAEQKARLRRDAIKRRDELVVTGAPAAAVIPYILKNFAASGQIVALYKSRGSEFDTGPLLTALHRHGSLCALPVAGDGRVLRFARVLPDDALVSGPYDILQPRDDADTVWLDPGIVVVPLLACDAAGNRIGYGGGYYDATLAALRKHRNIIAVGLCHTGQLIDTPIPVETHDQKLDCVVTPDGIHTFGRLRLAK